MGETTKQLIERARAMVANYPLEHGSRGAIDIIAKLVSEIDRLRLTSAEICKARHAADPPQDCDWPFCGCDPAADRVLEAISESGLSLVRTAHTEAAGQSAPYGPMCRDQKLCAGKGYCPRDPTCGD